VSWILIERLTGPSRPRGAQSGYASRTSSFPSDTAADRPSSDQQTLADLASGSSAGVVRTRVTTPATRAASARRRAGHTTRLYSCPHCPVTFTKRSNLEGASSLRVPHIEGSRARSTGHIRSHEGNRPFQCQWCGRPFTRDADRRRHERLYCRNAPEAPGTGS
jgi:hypothetical protein